MTRADRNNSPAAFTTSVAQDGGLTLNVDYAQGDPFTVTDAQGRTETYYTAKLLGDPVALTIRVLDTAGWQTHYGAPRWTYMDLPNATWLKLAEEDKRAIIKLMYHHEGGTALLPLFT